MRLPSVSLSDPRLLERAKLGGPQVKRLAEANMALRYFRKAERNKARRATFNHGLNTPTRLSVMRCYLMAGARKQIARNHPYGREYWRGKFVEVQRLWVGSA